MAKKEESEFSDLDMKQAKSIILSGLKKKNLMDEYKDCISGLLIDRFITRDFKILEIAENDQYHLIIKIEVEK